MGPRLCGFESDLVHDSWRPFPVQVNVPGGPAVVVMVRERDDTEASFDDAFDRLYPQARALAHRVVRDAGSAEDVAAEALARAYSRWRRLSTTDHVDAWVLRVAGNLAIDAMRRKRPLLSGAGVTTDSDGIALRLTLADALRQLPRRQREVLVLRFLADLRQHDVALALGITEGAVKAHAHRGLLTLRSRLGDSVLSEEAMFNHA